MSGDGQALRTDQVTLQTILQLGYTADACKHRLPDYVRRAVWAIVVCRTAVLGGHVQACPDGHVERIWYNSCRHRMCPQCAWVQTERWLAKQKGRLLACEHYHVIFTMPHELNGLWLANVEVMSGLLFASVHDTLVELLGDRKYLGATPGIIATLHSWSQTLLLHPHIHCLVSGGGLRETGQWVGVQNGFLLPMRVVMALFRGKLLAAIRQALAHGQQVVFRYEERAKGPGGQAKPVTMRLPLEQFVGRFLLHVPPPHAVRVRCWGLYAHAQGPALAQCRQQLGQGPVEVPQPWDWPRACAERGAVHPEGCPICGRRLMCTALIPRAGVPPPTAAAWEQVA